LCVVSAGIGGGGGGVRRPWLLLWSIWSSLNYGLDYTCI